MKKDVYELTNPQKSIWLTEEFYKGSAINNICGNLIIREKVDFDKFIKAINLFVKTNESFRLKFFVEDSTTKQYVSDFSEFKLDIIDVKSDDEIAALQRQTASEVFEIIDSLLFKFKIVRLPDGSGGFIVNAHHLISDAATFAIIATEIVKIYSSLINNTTFEYNTNLYTDYIKSEQIYMQSEKFKKDEAYWNELYKVVPEVASIPSLLKDSSKVSTNSLRKDFIIPKELFEKTNAFCKENRISSFNLFMAIYAIYLGRVSNLDEFVIGTPILNRTNFSEKNTSGMFISTAPFKISIIHNQTFVDFVKKIGTDSLSMLRHQKYPYQFLLQNLRKKGSHIPNLYDFIFSYQITKATDKNLEVPYTTHWIGNNQIANSLEVHAHDNDSNGNITIAYDYKTEKYSKEDITNLHNRILCLLEQIIDNPKILLEDIEIVTPEEKHKILYEFNNTKVDYPKDKTIVDLFEEQVEKTPDNIAVVFEDQKLTYRELNEKANSLAEKFLNKIENKPISIICEKSLNMIAGIIGILKSGNSYVPIDPEYPEERIKYIIEDSKSELVFISEKYYTQYKNEKNILLDISTKCVNVNKNINRSKVNNLAYIIYTSGTTGKPKGVKIKNCNIVNTLLWRKNYYDFTNISSTLQIPTFSFDSSVEDIFTPLISGTTLVIPNTKITEINNICNLIQKNNVQNILVTPEYYKILLKQKSEYLKKLKYITIAGESFQINLVKEHFKKLPNVKLINEYGPTENSVCSTAYEFSKNDEEVLIGKPINNCFCYILDKNLKLLPIGTKGELYLSGVGISDGYLNNKELNEKSFLNNPYNSKMKLYKTGDIAQITESGNIKYISRADNQTKINGFRIEINEIKEVIIEKTKIQDCYVMIRDINSKNVLCVYYTEGKEQIDPIEIKKKISKFLPKYMVPNVWIKIDSIPLTINGKIDKSKLPSQNQKLQRQETIAPRNKTDIVILEILTKLLNNSNIQINDNFYELGIDSLLAITFATAIENKLKVNVNSSDILESENIINLSDNIDNKTNRTNIVNAKAKKEFYLLSDAQKRIYYASKLKENSLLYNIAGGIIFDQEINVKLLEVCFKEIINRHSSLRTYFITNDRELFQKVEDKVDFDIEIDNNIYKKEEINKICYDFIKPFDLEKAPLIRTKVVRLENSQSALLLNMHHIISDGMSLEILIKELSTLYNKKKLSDECLEYKDFVEWENEQKNKEEFAKAKEFWIKEFSEEIPLLNMPTTYARPINQSFEGKSYNYKLNKEIVDKISQTAKKLNITPYMLMLSTYYILLSKYTSQDDIVVGTPTSGRELPELENIIGMFVNTLAVRNKVENAMSFKELSHSIREKFLECLKNQKYPFDMLVKDLEIKRDTSRNPIFDTMFTYQNNGYPKINFQDIEAEYYIPDNNISKFDISVEVVPHKKEYDLRFEYCTELFDEKFIKRFSSHYINILNIVLENTEIKISEINMLSEEEKNKILYEFNKTQLSYPKNKNILDLFEEQVKKTPRRIAVEFENEKITYKELNEKSNNITKNLIKKGIKKGDIIGVCLKRNIELIISIWGILKAGAVYMPIYTGYPIDRIRYVLKDSDAQLLITNSEINPNVDNIEKLFIDDYKQIKRTHKERRNNEISSKDLLYVIYTSGSTGKPKGVKITHQNLINFIYSFKNYYKEINGKDIFLASTNISFDVSIWELFLPILSGAKLVLHSEEIIKDIKLYCQNIIEKKITGLYIPPNILDLVYDILSKTIEDVKINKLLIGVEPIKNNTINKYFNINKEMCIINGYGPTETTICATALNYKKSIDNDEIVPIGKPLKNNQIYIVNKDLKLQPIGIPGEIIVSGDGVGDGYINNEEQNLKNFIVYNNKRAYRTGDLAKWSYEGIINFIGRNDEQVKISGYRIELKEISSVLESYPNISKVYTTTYRIGEETKIIAYFTADINLMISDIKSYLQTKLPFYMVPKEIIQISKFPTTVNGKIDKTKLPTPQGKNFNEYVEPRNDFEKKVQKIWEELLHIDKIGINDNVFDLGCDSLTAIKFQTQAINQELDISYGDIFACPTIKLLSERKNKIIDYTEEHYDYTKINKLIEKNKSMDLDKIKKLKNKNILLLGSTGFLGAHILDNYLSNIRNSKVYCVIRSKDSQNPEERLKKLLNFYFDKKYNSYFGKRIIVIKGDITKKNFDVSIEELEKLVDNIDVVINSAAIVKHYGKYENFDLINVKGTKNVADFCKRNNKKLYHISTTSVSGIGTPFEKEILEKDRIIFDETSFYIGQKMDNVYIKSKFEAEKLILEEILNGLDGTILRVGNLTNRYSDGKFQINVSENAFLNRVTAIIKLGVIQKSFLEHSLEFTPIDNCAEAITKIINTKHNFSILHLSNINLLKYEDLINYIEAYGYKLNVVDDKSFSNKIKEALKSEKQRNSISGIITDLNDKKVLNYVSEVITKSEITNKFLNKINFNWPKINEKYIKKYINYLNEINYL